MKMDEIFRNYRNLYDISMSLSDERAVYPGDPKPQYSLLSSLSNGDLADIGMLEICTHNGTHVDAPSHIISGGKKINEISFEHWVGYTYVADLTYAEKTISSKDIGKINLKNIKRLLIKTCEKNCVYLEDDACEAIAAAGIITVGICSQSVDPLVGDENLKAHKILLSNDICIIENLILDEIAAGEYYMVCMPLKIDGADAAPARVLLLK